MRKAFDRGRLRTVLVIVLCVLARPTTTGFAAGLALVALGCGLHVWAKGCLRICAEVTTSGPYRWVRNPFYLAALVIEAGYCVAAGVPVAFPCYLLAWYLTYGRTIRREERTLRRLFGERFDEYLRAVPRLLPWRGPARGLPASRPFDWANPNLLHGREYPRVARILMPPFLFAIAAALRHGGAPVTAEVPFAIAVVALLEIVRRAALRRFKAGRRSLPAVLSTPAASATAVAAICAIGAATYWPAAEGEAVPIAGLWLAAATAILALGMLPSLARSRPLLLLVQSAACLATGLAAQQAWLAAFSAAWLVLVAIEATERPSAPQTERPRERAAERAAGTARDSMPAVAATASGLAPATEAVP